MNQAEQRRWYESAVIAPRIGVRPPEFQQIRLRRSLALLIFFNMGSDGASPS